jgi:hypothetical protein
MWEIATPALPTVVAAFGGLGVIDLMAGRPGCAGSG